MSISQCKCEGEGEGEDDLVDKPTCVGFRVVLVISVGSM